MANPFTIEHCLEGFKRAKLLRGPLESRFDQAFHYAMPGRNSYFGDDLQDDVDDVFDETAIVATQEFASRLQSGITPNFSRWAQLQAGSEVEEGERKEVNLALDGVTEFAFEVIAASNFSQESYETYLDLSVTVGFMEIEKGDAINPCLFTSVPATEMWIENGPFDKIDRFYRLKKYTYDKLKVKYPDITLPPEAAKDFMEDSKPRRFLECTFRNWDRTNEEVYWKMVIWIDEEHIVTSREYVGRGSAPTIAVRWSKSAGEVWGRGPLLNALPAIKTVNLVMQMILENAQMSISGMYNYDDDGVVNVDTIEILPGTIIPSSPGSKGLTPIQSAGNFSVAELVLNEMRGNIKRALYNDMLGNPNKTPMSATEVAERMSDLARQIGAAFGRLQAEFMQPVIQRVIFILKEFGMIDVPVINGREIKITAVSPLAMAQNQQDITNVDRLVEFVQTRFGPEMANILIKGERVSTYVGDKLQVPEDLIRSEEEAQQKMKEFAEFMQQQQQAQAAPPAPDQGDVGIEQ